MKTQNLLRFILAITSVFLLTACGDKEGKGNIELNFIAYYDGDPIVWNEAKEYYNGERITLDKLDVFLSDMELISAGSDKVGLSSVELLQFMENQLDGASAAEGVSLLYRDIPEGVYTGLNIGIGVSDVNNARTPSDFTSSNPLSRSSYYWDAWKGYIFTKMEGNFAEAGQDFNRTFVFHTGSVRDNTHPSAYRIWSGTRNIEIKKDQTAKLTFKVDVRKLFGQPGGTHIDIKEKSGSHNLSDAVFMTTLIENYLEAIQLD